MAGRRAPKLPLFRPCIIRWAGWEIIKTLLATIWKVVKVERKLDVLVSGAELPHYLQLSVTTCNLSEGRNTLYVRLSREMSKLSFGICVSVLKGRDLLNFKCLNRKQIDVSSDLIKFQTASFIIFTLKFERFKARVQRFFFSVCACLDLEHSLAIFHLELWAKSSEFRWNSAWKWHLHVVWKSRSRTILFSFIYTYTFVLHYTGKAKISIQFFKNQNNIIKKIFSNKPFKYFIMNFFVNNFDFFQYKMISKLYPD